MIDDLLGNFWSGEIKGGGEGIGFCGRGCDDGDGEGAWGGNSGSGVDDMAVGAAILFEALEGSAGGAEGLILQFDLDEGLIGVEWIMESDGPWLEKGSGLVAEGIEAGPAAVDQGRGREGVIFEEIGDSVDGIAFADGAEVDFYAGIGGLDGAVEVVENEMPETSSGHGGFEFEVGWDAFGALHESPGSAEGAVVISYAPPVEEWMVRASLRSS